MRTETLTLEHKGLLFDRMKTLKAGLSEFSFASLYLFRHVYHHEVLLDKDEVFIKGKTYDGVSFLMPTRDVRTMNVAYLKSMLSDVNCLYPIPEEWRTCFPSQDFIHTYSDADSDYIYTVEKMASYKGSKLHKKRNLLKQFLEQYECQAYPLTQDRIEQAVAVLDAWQQETGQDRDKTDYDACFEAIIKNEALVICGILYVVNNEPAAFVLGEELKEDMFVLMFAKAKKKFKGIYQYVYNNFAHLLPQKYTYFNFEEDMGKVALKTAKSSYVPDTMLKKYRISPIHTKE